MWKPKMGECVWAINTNGECVWWGWSKSSLDKARWAYGNVFATKQLADLASQQVKEVLAKARKTGG